MQVELLEILEDVDFRYEPNLTLTQSLFDIQVIMHIVKQRVKGK